MMNDNNWAHLPKEILGVILNKLSIDDQYSFNFVCRHWYSAVYEAADLNLLHPISSPPWLLIPDPDPDLNHHSGKVDNSCLYYDPVNQKTCKNNKLVVWRHPPLEEAICVGSCYDWLAFIDTKCAIYLENPLQESRSILRLPPIDNLPRIESLTVLPDGNIEFTYRYLKSGAIEFVRAKEYYGKFVHKLVFSSSPSLSQPEECIAMMIYTPGYELAVCRLGDTSWTPLNDNIKCNYNLYYSASKKLFHVLCDYPEHSFEIWDLATNFSRPKSTCFKNNELSMTPPTLSIDEQKLRDQCRQHKYLAELNGKLLLVVRHIGDNVDKDGQIIDADEDDVDQVYIDTLPYKTFRFDAYEFDWTKQQWILVNRLGSSNGEDDDVLFLGNNNASAFSTRNFSGLQSNSIYFTDDYEHYFWHMRNGRNYGGHDLGIFNFNNNNIKRCYYSDDLMKICPMPVWISPNIHISI